jgi:2,4-dienoyl-CoA reductase-like NADH-dependent reductase (Old Yellow Enzyme family)
MGGHAKFNFRRAEDLLAEARRLGLDLPFSEDIEPLFRPLDLRGRRLSNRLAIHPMEGSDGDDSGGPGELTFRRYERFGAGGCGLIWFEAAAVTADGRSNPRQLRLTPGNVGGFRRLVDRTRAAAERARTGARPVLILQLTHSGRFSKPQGVPAPVIVRRIPPLEARAGLPSDYPLLEDGDLDRLQEDFVRAAELAGAAGFDGVDLKACHGYLVSELLGGFSRPGRYGGPFENRTRFLRETVARVRDRAPGLLLAVRLNAADALPSPFGFGSDPTDPGKADLIEAAVLLRTLAEAGVALVNITLGIPHDRPHFGRPFNRPLRGAARPEEHPLEGVARLVRSTAELQAAVPSLPLVGTGYSWLRQFGPAVAAGALDRGGAALIGFGRMAFAYPDFALDLRRSGRFEAGKVCLACSGCSELARAGRPAGCVVRDRAVYRPA